MDPFKPIKLPAIVTILRVPFIVLIALLPGLFASGQVKFTTIASSQEIGRADYLQLEFVVENAKQIDQLTPPDFPGFQIVQGPIQSSGMSIVNGNMSQYKALSFVLQPSKTGKFTIQGASAVVDGKRLQSNSVTIIVTASSSGSNGNGSNGNNSGAGNGPGSGNGFFPQMNWPDPFTRSNPTEVEREYILKPGENIKEKIHKNLFVKVQVDKTNCYVGEPIVATYKLYSRLSSESRVTKRPSLNGFSVYDMVDPASDVTSVEKLNGKPFVVHIIRKTQLIPLQPGTINLDPVEVDNTVHFVKGGSRQEHASGNALRDLFDQLSDDNTMGPEVEENVTLSTKPVTITVKPLPEENKPAGFNGAVGSFTIQAGLTKNDVTSQDEATLHVVVKGKGNLPVITSPLVRWPAGIEAFDPTTKEDIDKTTAPMSGSKTFDYTFTAANAGNYTIPPIDFSYFDPITRSYKKTVTTPLDLRVTAGSGRNMTARRDSLSSSAATKISQPAARLKTFISQRLEWIFAVIILSVIAFFLWRQNLRLKKPDPQGQPSPSTESETSTTSSGPMASPSLGATYAPSISSSPLTRNITNITNDPVAANEGPFPVPNANNPSNPNTPDMAVSTEKQNRQAASLRSVPTLGGVTIDPLQEARKLFAEGDHKGFYREINRAVWKAAAARMNLPASELNKGNIIRQLEAKGWDPSTILSLETILYECEMNLYTPAYDRHNMQQLLAQTETLLDRLV